MYLNRHARACLFFYFISKPDGLSLNTFYIEHLEDLSGFEDNKEKMSKNRVASAYDRQYNISKTKEINMESTIKLFDEHSQQYQIIELAIQYIEVNAQRQPELDEIASAI